MEKAINAGLYILYTANIRGNIELLPRLYTFLRQMKSLPLDEGDDVMVCAVQPVARPTLILDLGNSCSPQVWHCVATGGRSVLIVLDAMGYRAANISGTLTPEAHERLRDNLMSVALIDPETLFEENGVLLTVVEQRSGNTHADLRIILAPSDATRLDGSTLYLGSVNAGQVGTAHITSSNGRPVIQAHSVFDLPPSTPPDPTISATVDFVLNEARMYQRKGQVKR